MTSNLTDLLIDFDDNDRHEIVHLLGNHMYTLVKDNKDKVMEIHSQYHSNIQQYFKSYTDNPPKQNVKIAMVKAYEQLKKDYKIE